MPVQRAILVDGSRLICEMLKRVIEKTSDIEVVREVGSLDNLPGIIREVNANLLFFVLPPGYNLPDNLTNQLLVAEPALRIVTFWTDGSHVKMEWLGRKARDIAGITLPQLTSLLQQEIWTEDSGDNDQTVLTT
jgi:hypothetical protein